MLGDFLTDLDWTALITAVLGFVAAGGVRRLTYRSRLASALTTDAELLAKLPDGPGRRKLAEAVERRTLQLAHAYKPMDASSIFLSAMVLAATGVAVWGTVILADRSLDTGRFEWFLTVPVLAIGFVAALGVKVLRSPS